MLPRRVIGPTHLGFAPEQDFAPRSSPAARRRPPDSRVMAAAYVGQHPAQGVPDPRRQRLGARGCRPCPKQQTKSARPDHAASAAAGVGHGGIGPGSLSAVVPSAQRAWPGRRLRGRAAGQMAVPFRGASQARWNPPSPLNTPAPARPAGGRRPRRPGRRHPKGLDPQPRTAIGAAKPAGHGTDDRPGSSYSARQTSHIHKCRHGGCVRSVGQPAQDGGSAGRQWVQLAKAWPARRSGRVGRSRPGQGGGKGGGIGRHPGLGPRSLRPPPHGAITNPSGAGPFQRLSSRRKNRPGPKGGRLGVQCGAEPFPDQAPQARTRTPSGSFNTSPQQAPRARASLPETQGPEPDPLDLAPDPVLRAPPLMRRASSASLVTLCPRATQIGSRPGAGRQASPCHRPATGRKRGVNANRQNHAMDQ